VRNITLTFGESQMLNYKDSGFSCGVADVLFGWLVAFADISFG
jgi:hypothetical protein